MKKILLTVLLLLIGAGCFFFYQFLHENYGADYLGNFTQAIREGQGKGYIPTKILGKDLLSLITPDDYTIDSLDKLKRFILEGQKRGNFPTAMLGEDLVGPSTLKKIDLNFRTLIPWNEGATCPDHEDEIILAPSDRNHSIVCDAGDTVMILGSGDDWVQDSTGNDIIVPGKGDDVINSGSGNDILIFEPNWGHDTVTLSSKEVNTDRLAGYDGSYPFRYSSFLVFGRGIDRSDLVWDGNTLIHTKNGDSITINTQKINLLFVDSLSAPTIDTQFVPKVEKPREITLDMLDLESAVIKGEIGFFAAGNNGLWIVDLQKIDHPLLLSQTVLPGRVMNVQLQGELAFLSQGDQYLEGKKGWVSVVDVSTIRKPKILKNLGFGNNIYNVALADNLLFVPDTSFVTRKGQLHIYGVAHPSQPQLVADMDLPLYVQFLAYLNKRLYLSDFQHGISVLDVAKPSQPRLVGRYRQFKETVWSVKTAGNHVVVSEDDGWFSVIVPDRDAGIKKVCEMAKDGPSSSQAMSRYDALTIQGDYIFHAEGRNGVGVYQIEQGGGCKALQELDSGGKFVSSSFLVGDTLVAYNRGSYQVFKDLKQVLPQLEVEQQDSSFVDKEQTVNTEKLPPKNLSKEQLQTLLYKAAADNDAYQVKVLCDKGADPNSPGHQKNTPIEISAMLGNLDALNMLLENGGNANGRHGNCMMYAALHEKFEAMKLLQHYGGNIGQADSDGCTTLHYLAQDGTVEMIEYLVKSGVPVDVKCRGGETALTWAKYGKNEKVFRYLTNLMDS
ncbi:MAG: ankyrin repeat domain-containing protein [Desulfobulbus sp.]|nr:ankyrin repeat domain-containing protein [Desulfobulbus sp.]